MNVKYESKVLCVVQARCGSKRFPNKVLADIAGSPAIIFLYERLKQSRLIDQIVVATTTDDNDNKLIKILEEKSVPFFRGSRDNVLNRYVECLENFEGYEVIVRITGDCPLIDPNLIDEMLFDFKSSKELKYLSTDQSFPDGFDVEIFLASDLKQANISKLTKYEQEHVTPWIKSNVHEIKYLSAKKDYNSFRVTLDEKVDLDVIRNIVDFFGGASSFTWQDVVTFLENNPQVKDMSAHIRRNEGSIISSGAKLWKRAIKVIPTGNHLLSKNSEQILPDLWPSYFHKTNGCEIWDLDDNHYYDVSFMGVGTNTLGYNNSHVDKEIYETVKLGNMSTLNAPEEVYLAEKLIEMHPHFDQVRFARTGGEANSIAIRLARAATGKDKVAICGYHGWHDWYLATNLKSSDNLNTHLLSGLLPHGVPKALSDSTYSFRYGNAKEFMDAIENSEVGTVIMEFTKSSNPNLEFLELVRRETRKRNIVLIFDECSTGFRSSFGGMHLNYSINPDMAMFGKALGNGYAITAVAGIASIMNEAENTFISSTFWTERIGFAAGLATLTEMEKIKSWEIITNIGNQVQGFWNKISEETQLPMKISGFPAISSFYFESMDNLLYKTFITQEMLKKGYLASNMFYASIAHKPKILDRYFEDFSATVQSLSIAVSEKNLLNKIEGRVCRSGFGRLN